MKKKESSLTRRNLIKKSVLAGLMGAFTPLPGLEYIPGQKRGLIEEENSKLGTPEWSSHLLSDMMMKTL